MWQNAAADQVTGLAENSQYTIVIRFQPHQFPESSQEQTVFFLFVFASLVLGC